MGTYEYYEYSHHSLFIFSCTLEIVGFNKKVKRARRADDIIGYSLLLFVFFFFNLIMK